MKHLPLFLLLFFSCLTDGKGQAVSSFRQEKGKIVLRLADAELQLLPLSDGAMRVRYIREPRHEMPEWVYVKQPEPFSRFRVEDTGKTITVNLPRMKAVADKATGLLTFFSADGRRVLGECGRSLEPSSVQGMDTYCGIQRFESPADEHLFGLGQFQDGYTDVRGLTRRLTQVNTQIAIPMVCSDKGYGLLWNNYGLTDFNPPTDTIALLPSSARGKVEEVNVTSTEGGKTEMREEHAFTATLTVPAKGRYALLLDVGQSMARRHHLTIDGQEVFDIRNPWLPPTASAIVELEAGTHRVTADLEKNDRPRLMFKAVDNETVFRSPVASCVDYTVFCGTADEVIASYRELTGRVPLMPDWALGYIHCRERFHNQTELLETAGRFRTDSLPMDMIVQDWQYWGRYGWNAMKFDEADYPDPKQMVDSLHRMGARLMLSVWSKVDPASEVGKWMTGNGYFIPGTSWVDFFSPKAAAGYWEKFSNGLLQPYGIDAWWQDATEPENDDLQGRQIAGGTLPGELFRNTYPLLVNKTVYEGLRRDAPLKRVMILTRSGFPGMQRYATATWSGDVGWDWNTLRRQLAGGLGMSVTGQPWWTYDAGGFFRPANQYTDPVYHECFLRWLQASVFLPLMRVHGYMSNTEPWNYGPEVTALMRQSLAVRYSLVPYLYAENARVCFRHGTLLRPLVMDFAADPVAVTQKYQYMFGPSLLVAPIVEGGVKTRKVYFPATAGGWYDFWSDTPAATSKGWQEVLVASDHIPVYVRAGSILPLAAGHPQTMAEARAADLVLKVFAGTDGHYTLYEDNGTDYGYEQGQYATIPLTWDDRSARLTIGARKGSFAGMSSVRTIRIVQITPTVCRERTVVYDGQKLTVDF